MFLQELRQYFEFVLFHFAVIVSSDYLITSARATHIAHCLCLHSCVVFLPQLTPDLIAPLLLLLYLLVESSFDLNFLQKNIVRRTLLPMLWTLILFPLRSLSQMLIVVFLIVAFLAIYSIYFVYMLESLSSNPQKTRWLILRYSVAI